MTRRNSSPRRLLARLFRLARFRYQSSRVQKAVRYYGALRPASVK